MLISSREGIKRRSRVALIIEAGKIRPVWFEAIDNPERDRIFIKEICSIWSHMEGAVKIISFSVWDRANNYCLSLDTKAFTWKLGITEERPFFFPETVLTSF